MTVPLDRLYHYIESVAQDIRGDAVIIYRFFPHGSKKIEDLTTIKNYLVVERAISPQIYCHDQEPLDYDRYSSFGNHFHHLNDWDNPNIRQALIKYNVPPPNYNLCVNRFHIYDSHIIIHSEQRSSNLTKYQNNKYFIPVYYWSHAIIALDWFRYAKYDKLTKKIKKTFLIYNRAWSGTREYRLKFTDLIIKHDLVSQCQITINPIEPELNIHYNDYVFVNKQLQPTHCLEQFVPDTTTAPSSESADYCGDDYCATEFEVVLETLFDDDRLHITEKTLRPLALRQPFILAATHGSLEYLRSYGFKTFADIFDETYDTIEDPLLRLEAIVKTMKEITLWSDQERKIKMTQISKIVTHNHNHFFSGNFVDQVTNELYTNLSEALGMLEATNTSSRFINRRKELMKYEEIKEKLKLVESNELMKILQTARKYYDKH